MGVLVKQFFGAVRVGVVAVLSASLCLLSLQLRAELDSVVAQDGDVVLTVGELRNLVDNARANVRSAVLASDSDRFEIVAESLLAKKIRSKLDSLDSDLSPDLFYRYQAAMNAAAKEFDAVRFQVQLELPDMEPLAEERYRVAKDEIAVVPEQRIASHILLLCTEDCDRGAKRQELEDILIRALSGESFADLAAEYSQDPGSRQRGGRLSQPITERDERIDETFRETSFDLIEPGQISEVVESRFGFHIIRLDEVVPQRVYTFDEVKEPLIQQVEERYREDAYREYIRSMGPGEDFMINYEAIDAVLGPVNESEPR